MRQRWDDRDWALLAVAGALVAVGFEVWTRTVVRVRGAEFGYAVPGWAGLGYRTGVLAVALLSVAVGLATRARTAVRYGLVLALVLALLVPLLDRQGELDGIPPAHGGGATSSGHLDRVYGLVPVLILIALGLLAPGGAGTPAVDPASAGQSPQDGVGWGAGRRLSMAGLAGVLLGVSLLPWFSTRSAAADGSGARITTSSVDAWHGATGWTAGIVLAGWAGVFWAGRRPGPGSRRLVVAVLVLAGIALLWPWRQLTASPELASGQSRLVSVHLDFQLPQFPPAPRADLTPYDRPGLSAGPEPVAVLAPVLVGLQLGLVLLPIPRRRAPG